LWSIDPTASFQKISNAIVDGVQEVTALGPGGGTPVASGGRLDLGGALTMLSPEVVIVAASDNSIAEPPAGTSTATFAMVRSGPATSPVTVHFTITGTATNGSDYATIGDSVTLAAGENSAFVTVTPLPDELLEGSETVVLTLTGNSNYAIGVFNAATITITDSAQPVVTIMASDAVAAETGNDSGTFTITRTGATTAPLTVALTVGGTASNGSDYTTISTSATILAGASSVTVTVNPIADGVTEPTETVILTLAANGSYLVGTPSTATVTISDTSAPPVPGGASAAGGQCAAVGERPQRRPAQLHGHRPEPGLAGQPAERPLHVHPGL
jgi:hypothetical protein